MTSTPHVSVVEAGPKAVSRRVEVQAPAAELFELVADPRRHGELDGSGTVGNIVSGPPRLATGDRFSVRMNFHGIPYTITSEVTQFQEGALLEWLHPFGHRWRWEFSEVTPGRTQVTETWDYSGGHARFLEFAGYRKINGEGISRTLLGLSSRFADSP